jgi:hypothetical protein
MIRFTTFGMLAATIVAGSGCGGDGGSDPDADVPDVTDVADLGEGGDSAADADADPDVPADGPADIPADGPADGPADATPTACGPSTGTDCGGGEWCDIRSCDEGATGTCVADPGACPEVWVPVCGCDGTTYASDCERLRAAAALDHDGACASADTCGGGTEPRCEGDLVCDLRGCEDGVVGACVVVPDVCPDVWDPVCACTGRTFNNDCERLRAGAALDHDGICDTGVECGGAGGGCPPGQFCNVLDCDAGTTGTCVAVPMDCSDEYDPVCGCNGVTYGNDCLRIRARAAFDHDGACGSGASCGGVGDVPCGEGELCDIRNCALDAAGVCVTDPDGGCPVRRDPVCGCDGVTYDNDCLRLEAGTALDHDGACAGTTCIPECRTVGAGGRTGWVDPCTGRTFCRVDCTGCTASCEAVDTRSEGWYSTCADPTVHAGCPDPGIEDLIAYDVDCG